jgi:flagellar motor switch protein FliM
VSKIVSQEEVNALLNNPTLNKTDPVLFTKNVKIYDFKHPDRISKDQLRALKTIHSNFAKSFGTFLSTKLRTTVDMNVMSVDQLTYSEFTMMMASPSCIYIIGLGQDSGRIIIEFSPELVFFIIDRLLGGRGDVLDEMREITIIEENVLKKIVKMAIKQLDISWQHVQTLSPHVVSFETNPQFVQIAPASEPSIVISFNVKIHNFNSIITICFPYFVLEPVMPKLNIQTWIKYKQSGLKIEQKTVIQEKLQNTKVELCARLSSKNVKLEDVMRLEIGDVLVLDKKVDNKFQIQLEGRPKFLCRPGMFGKNIAVKITDIFDEEVENKDF